MKTPTMALTKATMTERHCTEQENYFYSQGHVYPLNFDQISISFHHIEATTLQSNQSRVMDDNVNGSL